MYHVGTNKRSHDSAELIYYGVAICSQDKPLESVTISDVQRVTGIARTRIISQPADAEHPVLYE